jgi:hypothetical protein
MPLTCYWTLRTLLYCPLIPLGEMNQREEKQDQVAAHVAKKRVPLTVLTRTAQLSRRVIPRRNMLLFTNEK